jgi:hypothetical protein
VSLSPSHLLPPQHLFLRNLFFAAFVGMQHSTSSLAVPTTLAETIIYKIKIAAFVGMQHSTSSLAVPTTLAETIIYKIKIVYCATIVVGTLGYFTCTAYQQR